MPAIGAFLNLLEADIRSARNITALSDDIAQAMLANAHHAVSLDEDIDGDVALCPSTTAGRYCSMKV